MSHPTIHHCTIISLLITSICPSIRIHTPLPQAWIAELQSNNFVRSPGVNARDGRDGRDARDGRDGHASISHGNHAQHGGLQGTGRKVTRPDSSRLVKRLQMMPQKLERHSCRCGFIRNDKQIENITNITGLRKCGSRERDSRITSLACINP